MRAAKLTVLDQIIVRKRAELIAQQAIIGIEELEQMARPPRRPFRSALEMKRPAAVEARSETALEAARHIASHVDQELMRQAGYGHHMPQHLASSAKSAKSLKPVT